MAEEYLSVTGINGAEAQTSSNNKDEETTTIVHENGYESECSSSSRSEIDVARSALEAEADAFTRFIERQRVEVMFELRNLRLGERPVTGQPNRDRIQTFINNVQQERQQRQQQTSLPRTFSSRSAVPSAHVADIDALANRRCVSAALGSGAFRQDLENAIRRSIDTHRIPQAPAIPRTLAPSTTQQPAAPPAVREPPRAAPIPPVRRQEPLNIERQENELQAWQTITQLQQEIIVLEISDLVHRQLVSSALESDFRSHLEQSILSRLAQGAPQENQQRTVAVPATAAPRILPTPAPVRPPTQTRASTLTTDDISTRLDSMQQMLHLMFSMQMDMQRSLRQEVASAMAADAASARAPARQPINSGHCTVCLSAVADTVLYRCGHLCVCYTCGLSLREAAPGNRVTCPICRAPVEDILRVYRSSRDGE